MQFRNPLTISNYFLFLLLILLITPYYHMITIKHRKDAFVYVSVGIISYFVIIVRISINILINTILSR